MGELFQIQDDHLDVYGDPVIIGKVGTDIAEGKCTWLVVQALSSSMLTEEHKEVLGSFYGRPDGHGAVKQVYRALDLDAVFHAYEEDAIAKIRALIQKQSHPIVRQMLVSLSERIFYRKK